MEPVQFSCENGKVTIKGFPDAVRVIAVTGRKSKKLSDLALHHFDLQDAKAALETINHVDPEPRIIRESLWRNAIVLFCKCFSSSQARGELSKTRIYGTDSGALEAFEYFKLLRNKHLIHDENAYSHCPIGAILNPLDAPHPIAKVIALPTAGVTLEEDNYSNLHQLVTVALNWVGNKYNELCNGITIELNAVAHLELLERPILEIRVPTLEDLRVQRQR